MDCTRGHQTFVGGEGGAYARLTQHPIAVMTGSVREVVQRALERDGAIWLERTRVVVLDPNALEHWSDAEASRTRPGCPFADRSTLIAVGASSVSTIIPS